jgi:Superinfection immunity protein
MQSEAASAILSLVLGLVALLVLALVYLLPTLIAFARGHHQRAAICVTNLFLGTRLRRGADLVGHGGG